ncbi:MAG: AAA family ATPase [Gammaproteobacteria bacterium]|nr:AAA family ATPase [Gammaproteobacteria bacterium]
MNSRIKKGRKETVRAQGREKAVRARALGLLISDSDFTAAEIARKIGVTPMSVSNWTNGKTAFKDSNLDNVLMCLGLGRAAWEKYYRAAENLPKSENSGLFAPRPPKRQPRNVASGADELKSGKKMKNATLSSIWLNRIFYGPPGTGKTYHTVNAALEILDNEFYQDNKDDRRALKRYFDELQESEKVSFVTFHQSFGYEEFVEGIRPVMSDESANVSYEIKDGIFKRMCAVAKDPWHTDRHASAKRSDAPISFDEAIVKLQDECESGQWIPLRTTVRSRPFTITSGGREEFICRTARNFQIKLKFDDLKRFFYREELPSGPLSGPSYIKGIVKHILEKYSIDETIRQGIVDEATMFKAPDSPHVLIIDEINRGNVSRIFGELITLLENSKRLGNDEAVEVELPYSGDTFSVPNNLYIIGTMNTADRSIALLDTALRRRFRFVEMMPDLELLAGVVVGDIQIQKLLAEMNKRIEVLYDRDHQIGHSFFLRLKENPNIETLAEIFQHEILPLLQEYFYDDWEKINMVLNNNGFLAHREASKIMSNAPDPEKKIWKINHDALKVPANYQKIYANAAADDNAA